MLAGLQGPVTVAGVGGGGVSGDEDVGGKRRSQERVHHHPARVVTGAGKLRGEGGRLESGAQHDRVSNQAGAVVEDDPIGGEPCDGGTEVQLHLGFAQGRFDHSGRSLTEFGSGHLGSVDEYDP